MSNRSVKTAARTLGCGIVFASLYALAPTAARAGDEQKDFGNGVYSPAKGVVCDRQAGFCADGTGISMSFTEQYLGAEAVRKFTKMTEGGAFDDQNYTLMNGNHCETQKQKCFKTKYGKEVAEHLTKRLFK
jgi:hypothetical protein